eukprot:TRINITY_DN3853_c0_g1_i1.p5 TRINITY_DN3853_c0_g1~~TRINITY_DN3853_c0_g1_i1.p5  ORF type:complete len:111 (+),score=19.71 TRINITY_DN3853_c0_g1_i1:1540-1872(+)
MASWAEERDGSSFLLARRPSETVSLAQHRSLRSACGDQRPRTKARRCIPSAINSKCNTCIGSKPYCSPHTQTRLVVVSRSSLSFTEKLMSPSAHTAGRESASDAVAPPQK